MVLYPQEYKNDKIVLSNLYYTLTHKDNFKCGTQVYTLEGELLNQIDDNSDSIGIISHGFIDHTIGMSKPYKANELCEAIIKRLGKDYIKTKIKNIFLQACYAGCGKEQSLVYQLASEIRKTLSKNINVIGKMGEALNFDNTTFKVSTGLYYNNIQIESSFNKKELVVNIEHDALYRILEIAVIKDLNIDIIKPLYSFSETILKELQPLNALLYYLGSSREHRANFIQTKGLEKTYLFQLLNEEKDYQQIDNLFYPDEANSRLIATGQADILIETTGYYYTPWK